MHGYEVTIHTEDTPKRNNYLSIQLKHHVPSQFSETNYIRTGYETVVAHRTSETFACVAQRDGIVQDINYDLGIIKISYTPAQYKNLDLQKISSSSLIRNKFSEMAQDALVKKQSIYIVQDDQKTSVFKIGDIYSFEGHNLKVTDIAPLELNHLSFDYLTDVAKSSLKKLPHPIIVKLAPMTINQVDNLDIFKFGTKFTSVQGSYLKQTIIPNVKIGDKISKGDVIAYNTGFFERDMFDPTQITWKHGIMANVVLMESDSTIEDSNAITEAFSKRMQMEPAHLRTLELNSKTSIRDLIPIGTEVQTTDLLCSLEDSDIASLTSDDDYAVIDLLNELNRKAPRARYHGIVEEIDVFYSCPIEDMHPTVAALVTQINKRKLKLAKLAKDTHKASDYVEPSLVQPGTKYHGIEFTKDTILIMIYISEKINHDIGSKSVLGLQMKTILSNIIEQPIYSESGYPIDMIFGARGVNNRLVTSPLTLGTGNRCLFEIGRQSVDFYFKE